MKQFFPRLCLTAALALSIAACGPVPGIGAKSTVIVDLGAVAKATGQDVAMEEQMQAARTSLEDQLTQIAGDLEQQLLAEQEKLGEAAQEEAGIQTMQQLTAQARQQLSQSRAQANQRAQQYQTQLASQFRDTVRPIVARIAEQRGAGIVMVADSSLFWFNPSVDITDEVIAEIRARDLSFPEPEPVIEQAVPDTSQPPEPSAP